MFNTWTSYCREDTHNVLSHLLVLRSSGGEKSDAVSDGSLRGTDMGSHSLMPSCSVCWYTVLVGSGCRSSARRSLATVAA